jgi:UDP-N-acetylmuramoyl-tripeptide--D-alanyl-D-alanine ligase
MEIPALYKIWKQKHTISTDSRNIEVGCIFFALKGENFNGNAYAESALEKGAAYVIVDDIRYYNSNDDRYIFVEDVLSCLQLLANHHRKTLNIPVLAITGSNGKTTTKELSRDVISKKYKTHATVGNLNNHIGVPLTILAVNEDIEFLIVEMGANHQGEIEILCKIAEPSFTMITNIGKAHLEGFGGVEGIKKGKSEMYRYAASNDGTIFVNIDDSTLLSLVPDKSKTVKYSANENIKIISEDPTLVLDIDCIKIHTHLYGNYNKPNIAFAIALGKYFNIPTEDICVAISQYIPDNNRSQLYQSGTTSIIKDAYNANPSSMRLSIESFGKLNGNKIMILGDMLELGDYTYLEHEGIIELASNFIFEEVIFVGRNFMEAGKGKRGKYFLNVMEAREYFQTLNIEHTTVLLKGSRGIAIEKILN